MLTEHGRKIMSESKKGEKNPRWNGGVSEYPNHTELKKIRIEVLKNSKCRCEICGKPAKLVHHINEDKSDHSIDNLIALCRNCHELLHCDDEGRSYRGRLLKGSPNKYSLIYGMTINEIAKCFGVTNQAVYYWIRKPEKKIWLEAQLIKLLK